MNNWIVPPGSKVTRCSSCNAEIVWLVLPNGKRMPVSWKTRKERIAGDGWDCDTHFADCPNAKSHRKTKDATAARNRRDSKNAEPDWSRSCETCGASPIVPATGMCGPCTFGEADTANGNW